MSSISFHISNRRNNLSCRVAVRKSVFTAIYLCCSSCCYGVIKFFCYSQQRDAFYNLTNPKAGTFERVRDRLTVSNDEWLFTDDDGRVYLYAVGFKPVRGIYVYELDPKDHLKVLRGPLPCRTKGDVWNDNKGNFSVLPNREGIVMPIAWKTGEGASSISF